MPLDFQGPVTSNNQAEAGMHEACLKIFYSLKYSQPLSSAISRVLAQGLSVLYWSLPVNN